MSTAKTVELIAKWIVDSVSAEQIDRLCDHLSSERLSSDEAFELAEMLLSELEAA